MPAAHLSFMTKFSTPPWSLRRMTLVSCPPTSTMVRFRGEMAHPFGVTADLGDLLVRPLVGHPAIAGDHSVADLFRPRPCLGIGGSKA